MDSIKTKIVIIYGETPVDGILKNGEIERLYGDSDADLHIDCLIEYFKSHFLDVPIFQKLNYKVPTDTVAYYLYLMNNIIFFNTTKDANKYGNTGFFMIPKNISSEQKETLNNFLNEIEEFNIMIIYDVSCCDGIFDSKTKKSPYKGNPHDLFDSYFKEQVAINTKIK